MMERPSALRGAGRSWTARFRRAAHDAAIRGAAASLALRLLSSGLNVVLLIILARAMTPAAFGMFAVWFGALGFLSVLAGLGQEKLILRSWSQYRATRDDPRLLGAVTFGLAVSAVGAGFGGSVAFVAGWWLSGPGLAGAAALLVVLQILFVFLIFLNRAASGVASVGHDLIWRGVVIAASLAFWLTSRPLGAEAVVGLSAFGLAVTVAVQLRTARRSLPPGVLAARPRWDVAEWLPRSGAMAAAAFIEAANQFLDVVAVGLVLDPITAGNYLVASRIANIFAMIAGGFETFASREIARHHFSGNDRALGRTLDLLAGGAAALVVTWILVLLLAGPDLLAAFGPAYREAYPLLMVLAVGTAFVALAGPAPAILLLTGHERAYSLLSGTGAVARLLAIVLCASVWGEIGAAIASSLCSVGIAAAMNGASRRWARFDPSVARLLRA